MINVHLCVNILSYCSNRYLKNQSESVYSRGTILTECKTVIYRLPLFHKISLCNIQGGSLNHYVILSRIYERNDGFEQHWEFVYVCD